jgi:hypothetical protein
MSNTNTNTLLKSVEEIYLKGDYKQAIDTLIKSKGTLQPGLFHYNLGTLYLKMGRLGPSRYNLEKANKIGFSNPLVKNNINYIRKQESIISVGESGSLIDKTFFHINEASSYQFGFFLLLFSLFLVIAMRFKKISLRSFSIVFFVAILLTSIIKVYTHSNYHQAVIMNDVSIFEGPSKIYEESGNIIAGSKVLVSKSQNDWFYILSPASVSGWIKRSALGFY